MSRHVEGENCPVCGAHLFDDDDIVFCPICGAPHHRDCYNALGHCALEADHGTPRQYKRPEERQQNEDAGRQEGGQQSQGGSKPCPRCGTSCAPGTLFCPHCGLSLTGGPQGQSGYNPYNRQNGQAGPYQNTGGPPPFGGFSPVMPDPYGGVNPEEKIEDIPAKDIAIFVSSNTQRYLPKFKQLQGKSKASWNWAAFLFPSGWLFFRKCYKPGILVLLLGFISTVLSMPMQLFFNDVLGQLPTTATYPEVYGAMLQNIGNAGVFAWVTQALGLLLSLTIRIVIGVLGDSIYKNHVIESIRKIKADDNLLEDYEGNLVHKGGINPLMLLVAFLASNWFSAILAMFLI